MKEPKPTCPQLDKVKEMVINRLKEAGIEQGFIDDFEWEIELVRDANKELREWGEQNETKQEIN